MRTRSLSLRLCACFAAVLLGLWLCILVAVLIEASGASRARQERELGVFARMAVQALAVDAQSPDLAARAARFMALEDEMRAVYYADCIGPVTMQVWRNGHLVFDHGGLPAAAPRPAAPAGTGLARLAHGGADWLTASASDARTGLAVRMGTEDTLRFLLRKSNATYVFIPLVLSVPLLLVPLWFAVRVGLRPVGRIIDELQGRESADLAPLATPPYRELQPLTNAINSLMARLDERIGRERELLADAAHELKTPMAIIQAHADNLLAARDNAQRAEAQRGLVQGVRRGAHTVHQMLAYARSGAHAADVRLEPADLSELLLDRVASFATVGLARAIEVELASPPGVVLALHRESMVAGIDNILDNAVKYAPPGSQVRVTLAASAAGTVLEVADQGPGIPAALRGRVCERFYRIPGSTASGSGLGLAIARRALERNSGTLALDDAPGGGLRVTITLPAPIVPGMPTTPDPSPAPARGGPRRESTSILEPK